MKKILAVVVAILLLGASCALAEEVLNVRI